MNHSDILVINCGSSSLKFSVIEPTSQHEKLSGIAQCLGDTNANITFKCNGNKEKHSLAAPFGHQQAIEQLIKFLTENRLVDNISAIGHRVVHGGEHYSSPTKINDDVLTVLNELSTLAPLHNPANILGIKASLKAFNHLPQVAIFDTAFHQTMPETSYLYALPYHLYQDYSIRKYGFHGTSHYYVALKASDYLSISPEQSNLITVHLGNGCSITAIVNGQSIDTSMGFTPLAGFAMGTRSGDLDPGVLLHLMNQRGYTLEQIDKMLNKKSGLLGISNISNDCRTLEQEALDNKNERAQLALDIFCYQVAKSIASFSASLSTLDALVFTGGIGENSDYIRAEIAKHLSLLNIAIDDQKNTATRFGESGQISTGTSRKVLVIPTNEEWVIANQTKQLLSTHKED